MYMSLTKAKLCSNCPTIHDEVKYCPVCSSPHWQYLCAWLPPDQWEDDVLENYRRLSRTGGEKSADQGGL